MSKFSQEFFSALIAGDRALAATIVDDALRVGVPAREIYTTIVLPAAVRVGELWHEEESFLHKEKRAVEIAFEQMDRLRHRLTRRAVLDKRALVLPVYGEGHSLGARFAADLLYVEGWSVEFHEVGLLPAELVDYLTLHPVDLLGLSVGMTTTFPAARETIDRVRAAGLAVKIIVGGGAVVTSPHLAVSLAADAIVRDVREAPQIARSLLGLTDKTSLATFLRLVGERVHSLRKERGLSQQEVAARSGLERAYISAIEHGKHNITLGAVLRLAQALNVPFERLLGDTRSTV